MAREDIQEEDHVFAKIRYNHKGAYCHVKRTGEDEITCTFEEPQHAITPGQAVVLYEDGYVLGRRYDYISSKVGFRLRNIA